MNTNTTLMVIALIDRNEVVVRDIRDFTKPEQMIYVSEAQFAAADVAIVLDANLVVREAKRITSNNGAAFRLSRSDNAFGLEGWDFSRVLDIQPWMRGPRRIVGFVIELNAEGEFNGRAQHVNRADFLYGETEAA